MARKLFDLRTKTGTYVDRVSGETKNAYETIGSMVEWDDGTQSIKMKRTFNPAGVAGEGDLTIYLNEPKSAQAQQAAQQPQGNSSYQAQAPANTTAPPNFNDFDDDIPF